MKIYSSKNVLETSLDRIRWLFDEFEHVIVSHSGGKDSTVIYHLALQVAREKGRLPLPVLFLDQEAEWQGTRDVIKEVMYNPEVKPYWIQVPFLISNATSTVEHYLHAWDPDAEDKWIHPKDPIAYHENVFNETRFHKMFEAITRHFWPDEPTCALYGVRAEEAVKRTYGLTGAATYKGETWGRINNKKLGHYAMAPIYDWSYTDVWKAIHEHGWTYNNVYDKNYQLGVPVREMRISNLHHETSIKSLFILQETEPETYERVNARLAGVDMAAKMGNADYFVKELPFMFDSWKEYRDYLLENLATDEQQKAGLQGIFNKHDNGLWNDLPNEEAARQHVKSILTNDWEGDKIANWEVMYTGDLGHRNMLKKIEAHRAKQEKAV